MNAIIYKITCLTNLHVGNGESNFDIIDNAVEKDPVTGLPTINSSGVKGALRQYFKENGIADSDVISIFGSDQKGSQGAKSIPGKVKFYQADLLARPARATKGKKTNYMVTSQEAIELYNSKIAIFGGTEIKSNTNTNNSIGIEGVSSFLISKIELIDSECVVVEDNELRDLPLPVLARNQLDDGISKNLWYEQVVPHKSIFTFVVSSDDEEALKVLEGILKQSCYVQFGGNASIGYGLCKVEKIEGAADE